MCDVSTLKYRRNRNRYMTQKKNTRKYSKAPEGNQKGGLGSIIINNE